MASSDDAGLYVAYVAMLVLALIPIYAGAWKSVDLIQPAPTKNGKPQLRSRTDGHFDKETLSSADAYWFPITGSAVLFGLYLTFRFLDPAHVNLLLTAYFALMGVVALASLFATALAPVETAWNLTKYDLTLHRQPSSTSGSSSSRKSAKHDSLRLFFVTFSRLTLLSTVVAVVLVAVYVLTKHWTLNNLLGLAFAMSAITLLDLDSFRTGMILLAGLFVYDIFWVFGTDVMVSVARKFDAPVKMLFPKDITAATPAFTMLGLGDIVIPGIFVALCLRFDYHNYLLSMAKRKATNYTACGFATPYFTTCLVAYIAGLVTTVVVMHTFRAAQPALLYLSPACILAAFGTAVVRGEVGALFAYSSDVDRDLKDSLVPADDDEDEDNEDTTTRSKALASARSPLKPKKAGAAPAAAATPATAAADAKKPTADDAARKRKRLEAERFDFDEQTTTPLTKRVHSEVDLPATPQVETAAEPASAATTADIVAAPAPAVQDKAGKKKNDKKGKNNKKATAGPAPAAPAATSSTTATESESEAPKPAAPKAEPKSVAAVPKPAAAAPAKGKQAQQRAASPKRAPAPAPAPEQPEEEAFTVVSRKNRKNRPRAAAANADDDAAPSTSSSPAPQASSSSGAPERSAMADLYNGVDVRTIRLPELADFE
ncbi:hypothetical protein AMAG_12020 [Allomyces macrogynus ATCC 38327]|uniref:Signal peptide peptidase n=1 Tax=Allomyces macrogynus (strain ATCC 38327) TaxID=578462 RepID=A0A0L0SYF6_ALLM3|nr:hypothetical protein AMAG_12020 [Allomyces macrogynus ATCC 38327]|eukprot:KNE67568.1 hypothetical protein AMAG_12020 [Allomyces macrogynus ATCC 38327]